MLNFDFRYFIFSKIFIIPTYIESSVTISFCFDYFLNLFVRPPSFFMWLLTSLIFTRNLFCYFLDTTDHLKPHTISSLIWVYFPFIIILFLKRAKFSPSIFLHRINECLLPVLFLFHLIMQTSNTINLCCGSL